MKKLIALVKVSFLVPQVLFADIDGKDALKVLEKGVIINESSKGSASMSNASSDYRKNFSVVYKDELYICTVDQRNVTATVYCDGVKVKQ